MARTKNQSVVPSWGSPDLPVEIRLGQAISEFAQILDVSEKQKFQRLQVQLTQNAPPSPSDVIALTEQLNREGAKRHASWRPAAGTRIGGFLRRIQQFAVFGDILIGGSQNLIASGVWATVRAMLEATICHHVYFDQVSALLMRLTTSWSITQEFVQHFPGSKELQTFLAEYMIRIVRVCRQVLMFSKRSPAMLMAASLFSSFDAEFLPLQQELDQWGLLIENKFASLTSKTLLDGQMVIVKGTRHLTRFISANSKRQVLLESQQHLLNALSPNQDSFDSIFRRERKKGNCTWLLDDSEYKSWKETTQASFLDLVGHLGSGKTVGMANIVADITHEKGGCAFFFCKGDDLNTLTRNSIVGSILHQMIQNNLDKCHWNALEDGCRLPKGPLTVDSLQILMTKLLPMDISYFVVIDGLEECPQQELDETIQTLRKFSSIFNFSLCLSRRSDSASIRMPEKSFDKTYSVSLNDSTRDSEIGAYIKTEVHLRNSKRLLPFEPVLESSIIDQLTLGAQGMYLWVSLQLEAIFPSHTRIITTNETVFDILGKLPRSLPEAFNQALARISDKRYGTKVFALIAVAASPLTGDQLKVALTVKPGNTTWEFGKLPHDSRQLIACCGGSLLEIDEEDDKVRCIHHSVVAHLATFQPSETFNPLKLSWMEESEQIMGQICTTYLSYGIFDSRLTTTQKIDANKVVEVSKEAAAAPNRILAHLVRHIKNDKHRRVRSIPQLDVLSVLNQVRLGKEDDTVRCFLPYASEHWLEHTRFINAELTSKDYSLWKAILEEKSHIVKTPWDSGRPGWDVLLPYATTSSHGCLFQYILRDQVQAADLGRFRDALEHSRLNIKGPWLDDVLARCVAVDSVSLGQIEFLSRLLQLGASPDVPLVLGYYGGKLSSMALRLCSDASVPRKAIGMPLFQRIWEVISGLAVHADMSGCLRGAMRTGWDEVVSLILESQNPTYFLPLDDPRQSTELLSEAINHKQLIIIRLLIQYGTQVDDALKEQAAAEGRRAIFKENPIFSSDILDQKAASLFEFKPTSSSNLIPIYQEFVQGNHAASTNFPNGDSLVDTPNAHDVTTIYGWYIQHKYHPELLEMLEDPALLEKLHHTLSWSHLLHQALYFYHPRQDKGQSWNSSKRSIIYKLVSFAKIMGTLDKRDTGNDEGYTALHYAAIWPGFSQFSPVRVLLEAGADPNAETPEWHTPLEIVLSSGLPNKDIICHVRDLLKAGADPNRQCANGLTPLHFAAALACAEVVDLLIHAGADYYSAIMTLVPADVEKTLEMVCLIGSVEGWDKEELKGWGKMAEKATSLWDYHNIWRRKRLSLVNPRSIGVS